MAAWSSWRTNVYRVSLGDMCSFTLC